MVMFAVIAGSGLSSTMLPWAVMLIVEPGSLFALVIAARRLPDPLSLRLDTVYVEARAEDADRRTRVPKTMGSAALNFGRWIGSMIFLHLVDSRKITGAIILDCS